MHGVGDTEEEHGAASLRGTGFWLLWCNVVSISLVGSADRFTFEWLAGSTLDAPDWASGLVLFCLGAPVFAFVLVAGALADRGNRRRMLLTTQFGGVVVLSLSAVMVWSGVASVPAACAVAVAFGMVAAFSQPVRSALTPMLVPRDALMHAIVDMTIGSNAAMIAGPLVAGSVIDRWGVGWAFAVQAVFFLVGLAMVWRLRVPPMPPREATGRISADVADGLRFVWRHASLRPLFVLLSVGGGLMMGGATALLPKLARDEFGRSAAEASGLFALMGVGLVCTSIVMMKHRQRFRRRGLVLMVSMTVGCTDQMFQGIVPSFLMLQALLVLWGVGGGLYLNMNQTLIQEATPHGHMGRVMALSGLTQAGLVPIGALVASALAGSIGPGPSSVVFGAVGLAVVLSVLALARELRTSE